MSLLSIIGTSAQSLLNIETQLSVTSQNIGNAQNPNYVNRNANTVDDGSLIVVDVSRQVNSALQQELYGQNATSAGQSYLNQVYQQLEQLDGSANGTPQLSAAMQSFASAYQALQAQPESVSAQNAVIQSAQGLVSAVQALSTGIESIATQVQNQAQSDVTSLNGDLSQIAQLNSQIVAAQSAGRPTADLEDQRDALVTQVSSLVPVSVSLNSDGSLRLATPDGVTLVDESQATQFVYNAYTLGTGGTQGTNASITIADQPGVDVSGSFTTGKIGSELNILRVDDAGAASTDPSVAPLEKMRRQLDAFVDQFYSSNAATPTAFQAAYNNAPTNTGELASNLFVVAGQGPGGTPQPAGNDRFGFELNPALTNGTATLKLGSATAVVQALNANSSATAISAGDVTNFSGTITALANAIAADQTQRAGQVSAQAQASSAAQSTVASAYSNATGVSMDQQLTQLISLQNTYNASGKIVSVTNSMFQTLITELDAA